MRKTLRELRDIQGWTQERLAAECGLSRHRIADFENGRVGPRTEELQVLTQALRCPSDGVQVRGRRSEEGFAPIPRQHQAPNPRTGLPRHSGESRLGKVRYCYPELMRRLGPKLESPGWAEFLRWAPSDSALETAFHLLELERGATVCLASTEEIGFDLWPVVDHDTDRVVSHHRRPALATEDWLLLPQVPVATPVLFRMDALLVVQSPRRTFIDLEIDGLGHDPVHDRNREKHIALPTLRLNPAEVFDGKSLIERLVERGYGGRRLR